MTNTPRDTQFAGFAALLFKEMDAEIERERQRVKNTLRYDKQEEQEFFNRLRVMMTRHAYDLVSHALCTLNPIAFQSSKDEDEIVVQVPDLTAWPEEEQSS